MVAENAGTSPCWYYTVDSDVVVCNNAPCHSKFKECVIEHPGLIICRLGPYSPMLNPVETVWSKMKAVVKQRMRVPEVTVQEWVSNGFNMLKR